MAPSVTGTTPPADAVAVDGSVPIEVTFTEAMNASSLAYALLPNVSVSVSWPAADRLRLTPNPSALSNCTVYAVQVSVKDQDDGLFLVAGSVPNPWRFLTECDRPYILSTTPVDGATDVQPLSTVVVVFSEAMECTNGVSITYSPPPVEPVTLETSCDLSNTTFTVRFLGSTSFKPGTRYRATVEGVDQAGNALVDSLVPNPWTFTVNRRPTVGTPGLSGSGCLDPGTPVEIRWTMDDDLDAPENLTVRILWWNKTSFEPILGPATGFRSSDSHVWTLPPVDVTTRIRIEATDRFGATSWNESTSFQIDTGPPWVTLTVPANQATGVRLDANITIQFSEPMNRTTVEAAIEATPTLLGARARWTADNRLDLVSSSFADQTLYAIRVRGTARDLCGAGRPMGSDFEFQFTTAHAPPSKPARLYVTAYDDSSISLAWDPVTTLVTGKNISGSDVVVYHIYRGLGVAQTELGETTATTWTDRGLRPDTTYVYTVRAFLGAQASEATAHQEQKTAPVFLTTRAGQASVVVSLAAVVVALVVAAQMRRSRKRTESEAALTSEIQQIVIQIRTVRSGADPVRRREREEALRARFASLVEGGEELEAEDRPHPKLDGLYRALAQALVRSPEVNIRRGREMVDARLGATAPRLREHGPAYRLFSEAEASVQSELFPTLPDSGRKALLLVYFYGLEAYLGSRLRGLVPPGATVLLGERGHINVRRRGWEQQWAGLTLGNLLYMMNHNTHLFIADLERWEGEVEPLLKEAVDARNRTAHPSREGPPLDRVRELVYRAIPVVEAALKRPVTQGPRREAIHVVTAAAPTPTEPLGAFAGREQIVRILYNIQGQIGRAGAPRLYDLVVTDQRLVGIMKKNLGGAVAMRAAVGGGLVGYFAERKMLAATRTHTPYYQVEELDNLTAEQKTSFSIPWDSIDHGKVSGLVTKTLELRAGGKSHYLQFAKGALADIEGDFLNRIPTLRP